MQKIAYIYFIKLNCIKLNLKGGKYMSIYNFSSLNLDGESFSFENLKGKVVLVVNTASKCGFTPQYDDLQRLYDRYADQGLEIVGFPCNQFKEQEAGNAGEIKDFCKLNYGVTFPIMDKTDVRGANAHPIFNFLTEKAPFEGFDYSHATSKILAQITETEYSEYMNDNSIKWNFTKFLISKDGENILRFEPIVSPIDMEQSIEAFLK